jgi:hypothetical protein
MTIFGGFMERSKQYFLDFLAGKGTVAVIFEPFLSFNHAETLIWRRGRHLWDTPAMLIDTLAYLTERTLADMIFPDLRGLDDTAKNALLSEIETFAGTTSLGVGVICDSSDVPLCENARGIDCLCVYGDAVSEKLPVIRMNGSIEDAITRGDSAWFCTEHCEEYLDTYGDRIRILGGLGLDTLIGGSPVGIYDRVETIDAKYHSKWACGSGGTVPDENYLELISVLGAFARIRG